MAECSTNELAENIFHLGRFRKDCYYQPIRVDFNPVRRINNVYKSVLPTFNQDGKFYTPSFLCPYEKVKGQMSEEGVLSSEKEFFERKIVENLSKPQIQKPVFDVQGASFCSLCSVHISSYWEHINDQSHKRKIKQTKANNYIHQLCEEFMSHQRGNSPQQTQTENIKIQKTKRIKKTKRKNAASNISVQNDDLIIKLPLDLMQKEKRTLNHTGTSQHLFTQNQKE